MREIKFKVYFPFLLAEDRWLRGEDEVIEHLMNPLNGKLVHDKCNFTDDSSDYYTDGSYILLQYTGLKDKNGVEIFDGDIIRYKDYEVENGKQIRHEVKIVASFDVVELRMLYCICDWNDTVEVIGNIYDNPELLDGDK